VVFDVNDLDENAARSWEWDVKRLTTSFVLACRDNGSGKMSRDAVLSACAFLREHMAEYSQMRTLDVCMTAIDLEKIIATVEDEEASKRAANELPRPQAQRAGT